MATTTEQLEIILKAQNQASTAVRQLVRDLDSVERGAKGAGEQTTRAGLSMEDALGRANDAAGALAGGLHGLIQVAGAAGFVMLAQQAGRMVYDFSQLGTRVENIGQAFERNIGGDAVDALQRLRQAAKGEINDMDLMLNANRAVMLGVTKDTETMARLLESARTRGAGLGLSTAQAFNDLITGIGRVSPEILDNLGILTGGQQGFANYAQSIGKAADELTDFEKRQYLVNKVLSDVPAATEPATNGLVNLTTAWQNYMAALAEDANLGLSSGSINAVAGWINKAAADTKDQTEAIRVLREFQAEVGAATQDVMGDSSPEQRRQLVDMTNAVHALAGEYWWAGMSADELRARINELASAYPLLAPAADAATNALASQEAQAYRTVDALRGVVRANYEARMAAAAVQAGAGVGMDPSFVGRLPSQGRNFKYTVADSVRADEQALKDIESRWDREAKAQVSGARSYASAVDDAAREAERALDDMRGRIDRAFGTSSVSDRDWWETNTGQYQDKPDEYLRRLRSAVEDKNSEWKDLLGGRGGDEAKLYLAQQEDAWRSGQWGQMGPGFDAEASRQAIIDAVRRQIEAERARQAMIESIMNDPQMLGMGLSKPELARAMGVEDYQVTGADQMQQMIQGAAATDFGAEITATITAQFRAKTSEWQAIGKAMMEAFLTGGTGAVSPMTMEAFAATMWPELAPRVQQVVAGGYPG